MINIDYGVKSIIERSSRFLVLVKPNGDFDLPGGRIEKNERFTDALCREIDEETGLDVNILNPIAKWQFYKTSNLLIQGITYLCRYIAGSVALCKEHDGYFWAGLDEIDTLNFGPIEKSDRFCDIQTQYFKPIQPFQFNAQYHSKTYLQQLGSYL